MTAQTGSHGFRAGRRRRRSRAKPMSDINVTPFVDVMLVLLIVFMVTAPLLTAGVPVNLPEAPAAPLAIDKVPITVSIDNEGRIFLGQNEVLLTDLVAALDAAAASREDRVFVRGDRTANYGTILRVMGTINSAGFSNIGLVALKEPDS